MPAAGWGVPGFLELILCRSLVCVCVCVCVCLLLLFVTYMAL